MGIWNRSRSSEPDSGAGRQARSVPEAGATPSSRPKPDAAFVLPESIRLTGELSADSDVEIRGQVEGNVRVRGYDLLVAGSAQVIADLSARRVLVRGQVVGNVTASERIQIESTGCVLGDLCSPSIQLVDGSRFTGGINKQAAPAKVTGHLGDDEELASTRTEIERASERARERGVYDRSGGFRPAED